MLRRGTAAALTGLVLAGGRSRRMGRDKGQLLYGGTAWADAAWRLLRSVCGQAFVSVNSEQTRFPVYAPLPLIVDDEPDAGPATGLLSAWRRMPDRAFLVVAVDMPLVDADLLGRLRRARDGERIATAYRHEDGTIEPLCAIWEPAARALVAAEVETGRRSLRRVLERADVRLIEPADEERLTSADTIEKLEMLGKKSSLSVAFGEMR